MRVFDPKSGKPFYKKTRRRFDEPGDARELTFSCYRGYAFLSRDRRAFGSLRSWKLRAALVLGTLGLRFDARARAFTDLSPRIGTRGRHDRGGDQGDGGRRAIAFLEENAPHWLPRITVREGNRVRRRFGSQAAATTATGPLRRPFTR